MAETVDLIMITIKILRSRTYTIAVERTIPVLGLKLHICFYSETSTMSEHQHLLFRGRVLNNDLRLSDYQIEEGSTLYLIDTRPREMATDSISRSQIFRVEVGNLGYLVQYAHNSFGPTLQVIPNYLANYFGYMAFLSRRINTYGNISTQIPVGDQRLNQILSHMEYYLQRIRPLLNDEVLGSLSDFYTVFENNLYVRDPSARRWHQGRVTVESGICWDNVGRSILELGRAISRTQGQNSLQLETSIGAGNSENRTQPSSEEHVQPSSPRRTTDEEVPDSEDEVRR